jgi:hypothetical protein
MTSNTHSHWHHAFLLKDLCDHGLFAVKNRGEDMVVHPKAKSLSDILPAVLAADNLYDSEGVPNYDLHIWLALATMLINAGDAIFTGVTATVSGVDDQITDWKLALDFRDSPALWDTATADAQERLKGEKGVVDMSVVSHAFLTVRRLTQEEGMAMEGVIEHHTPHHDGFTWKAMGDIDDKDLAVKMVSYSASVHPRMKDRTVANIPLYIAAKFGDAGLGIRQHWFPEDTSRSYARYFLSDGIDHFVMDFHGGYLAVLLSHLDKYVGRDEELGGIILDMPQAPQAVALSTIDQAIQNLPEIPKGDELP